MALEQPEGYRLARIEEQLRARDPHFTTRIEATADLLLPAPAGNPPRGRPGTPPPSSRPPAGRRDDPVPTTDPATVLRLGRTAGELAIAPLCLVAIAFTLLALGATTAAGTLGTALAAALCAAGAAYLCLRRRRGRRGDPPGDGRRWQLRGTPPEFW